MNTRAGTGLHDASGPTRPLYRPADPYGPLGRTESAARWRWTVGYYAVIVIVGIAVHQQFAEDVLGVPASRWLWKANEVYVLAVAIPLYWDFVATHRGRSLGSVFARSTGVTGSTEPTETGASASTIGTTLSLDGRSVGGDRLSPLARRVAWYSVLVAVLVCLEGPLVETLTGSRLPQRILTLRDVLVGLVAVSLYFDWSRGTWRRDGPRVVSWRARVVFFVLAVLANIAIFQQPVRDALGPDHFGTLDFHAEAFATLLFVPVYFDIVLPLTGGDDIRALPGPWRSFRRWSVLAVWVAVLTFFVWIGQGAARDWVDNSFGQWFVRSPEPPLAAIVYTIYFEVLRRFDGIGAPVAPHIGHRRSMPAPD